LSVEKNRLRPFLAVLSLSWSLALHAQESDGWSVDFGIERASVTIDDDDQLWGRERVQALYRDRDKGGVYVGGARLTRFGLTDPVVLAGGYRRLGDWTISGQLGLSPGAEFYFRQSVEAEISRRAVGTVVAHLKYRYLNFPTARVHILAPGITYYLAKGEIHARVSLVDNEALDAGSQSVLVRGQSWLSERLRLSGGVAAGERIFDVTSLPGVPAQGWVVYAETLIRIHERGGLGLSVGFAHEEPFFDRRNFGVYYRRWF
jgi:YaiO family outer membrane protein